MLNIYLPGYSDKNKDVTERLAKRLSKKEIPIYARYWEHWFNPEAEFSTTTECENLDKVLKSFKKTELGIIAKSIGSVVALNYIVERKLNLKYVFLQGVPVNDLQTFSAEFKEKLAQKLADTSLIVMQNSEDPLGAADIVEAEFKKFAKFEFFKVPQADHVYDNIEQYIELIKQFQPS